VIERINVPARTVFTPNLTNPNLRYAFVTENGLTLCEPNFMIGLGSHPAGATGGNPSMHKAVGPRFFRASAMLFPFSISALDDSADLPLETPNDSARRSDISLLGSSIKRAFLFGHGNKKHLSASISEARPTSVLTVCRAMRLNCASEPILRGCLPGHIAS
jgi:hypothetical protein